MVSRSTDLDRLDLDEVKRFISRRWKVILGTAFACTMLAAFVCVALTPIYTATSQILLDPRKQHVFSQDSGPQDSTLDSSIVDSQIPIILSTKLLAKVVNKEHLEDDSEFSGPAKQGLLDRLFNVFRPQPQTSHELPSLNGIDPKIQPIVLRLFNKIDVTRVAKSYVISIAVSSRDAAKAMRLANEIAATYVEDQVDVRAKSAGETATFFEERLGSLRDQVRQSEEAVANFRREHNLTNATMDGRVTVGQQQLQNLNEQLALATTDTAEKHARYDQGIQFNKGGIDLDSLPEIIRSPVITQLRSQQADLTRRAADLSSTYGPAYPAIAQIRAQKTGLDKAIMAEMKRLVSTLKNDYEVAKTREDSLRQQIASLSDVSGGDNDIGVKLRELERTNLANKALFENFLNRAKLAQEQSTFEEPDARLISPALEPTAPSSPKTKLILPVALVAGLVIGLGVATLLDVFGRDQKVSTLAAKAPTLGADAFILGRIPDVSTRYAPDVDCLEFFDSHPNSLFAQTIESLAEKVIPHDGATCVATLSSLGAGEGATSVSFCLGAAAAKAGRRVLLIDADLRQRGLSRVYGAEERVGLSEVLAGELSANKAIVSAPQFAILPAGQSAFSFSKNDKRLRSFIAEARTRFDLILIDAPVFDASPELTSLTAGADGFALVASWDNLLRETFITAVDAAADRSNFLGVILNRATPSNEEEFALAG